MRALLACFLLLCLCQVACGGASMEQAVPRPSPAGAQATHASAAEEPPASPALPTLAAPAAVTAAPAQPAIPAGSTSTPGELLPTAPATPAEPLAPAIQEARRLVLEFPPRIRAGDSDLVRLALEMDAQGSLSATAEVEGNQVVSQAVQVPDVYDTHNVLVEARLDMAGVQVDPPDDVIEPLLPGQKVVFIWSVKPDQVGIFRGTVWTHLRFVPKNGGPEVRRLLAAQRLEIQSSNLLGLGGTPARLVGGMGALAGAVISFDKLVPWMWQKLTRKKKGEQAVQVS